MRTSAGPSLGRPPAGAGTDTAPVTGAAVYAGGVNWSPTILDLRKCQNPIRTSVGHPTFSWTVFGQAMSYSTFYAFFYIWVY